MKYTFTLLLAITGLAFAASSCKKDPDPAPAKETGFISCKINGVDWKSAKASEKIILDGDTVSGVEASLEGDSVISIYGIKPSATDTSAIIMFLKLNPGKTGTYSGTTSGDYGALYTPGMDFVSLLTVLGSYDITYSINITSFDATAKKLSGTFTITHTPKMGTGTIAVTNGEFNDIPYSVE